MSGIMSDMQATITVRELQKDLKRVLARVERGQTQADFPLGGRIAELRGERGDPRGIGEPRRPDHAAG